MGKNTEVVVHEADVVNSAVQVITPMALIAKGMDQGIAIEDMAKLFDLQLRYEENEAKKAFNKALALFRSICPEIPRLRKGHNGKYAGLSETLEKVKPAMTDAGLSLRWKQQQHDGLVKITCILTHELGHSEETSLEFGLEKSGGKTDIHGLCSTVSYLERYTAFAALGISSREMDDDAAGVGEKVELITEGQAMDLISLMKEVKTNEQGFCVHFGIKDVAMLPAAKFDVACKMLEEKRRRLNNG